MRPPSPRCGTHWGGRWGVKLRMRAVGAIASSLANAVRGVERAVFRRLFGGLPVSLQDALEHAAAQPAGDPMVEVLVAQLERLTPRERLVWAAAADELPDRTAVSAYWVSLVALLLATSALVSGLLHTLLLLATACGIFLARYQARHASRLRVPGNLLRSLVSADGTLRGMQADARDTPP